MKVLFHLCSDENGTPQDAAFVDGNGRKWVIPYNEPTEFVGVQEEYLADRILEHLKYMGLIEVTQIRTRQGVNFDLEEATTRALECLEAEEKLCINDYIKIQLEDRIRNNYPPLPPQGRQLSSVIKHKFNLLRAGIRCPGWEPPFHMQDPNAGNAAAPNQTGLEEQIKQLASSNALLQQQVLELLKTRSAEAGEARAEKKKGKKEADNPTLNEPLSVG